MKRGFGIFMDFERRKSNATKRANTITTSLYEVRRYQFKLFWVPVFTWEVFQ